MGMNTIIYGIRRPDEKWKAMKAVWDACEVAGVEPPEEVSEFFDWEQPQDSGVKVSLVSAVSERTADMREIFEVDLSDIPKDVTAIQFINSY